MAVAFRECLWCQITSLHVGLGRADVYLIDGAEDLPVLAGSVDLAEAGVVGAGTNLIGSDRDGLSIVRLSASREPEFQEGGVLRLGAGTMLPRTAQLAAEAGLGGLAPLSGIPGTLGGAVMMNAGANGAQISDFLLEAEGVDLDTGKPWRWRQGDGGFAYRQSPVTQRMITLSVALKLPGSDPETERRRITEERERRLAVNPQGPSAGSIFKNPPGESAGRLLEAAGCKGLSRGGLLVSEKHANWILNPTATPTSQEDALMLLAEMQRRVPTLELEVRIVR